jgi:hypothetical protein
MNKNIEQLKVKVQIIALELAVPPADKKKVQPNYVTVVMKRGKKERIENLNEKLKYVPLIQATEEEMIDNI